MEVPFGHTKSEFSLPHQVMPTMQHYGDISTSVPQTPGFLFSSPFCHPDSDGETDGAFFHRWVNESTTEELKYS